MDNIVDLKDGTIRDNPIMERVTLIGNNTKRDINTPNINIIISSLLGPIENIGKIPNNTKDILITIRTVKTKHSQFLLHLQIV